MTAAPERRAEVPVTNTHGGAHSPGMDAAPKTPATRRRGHDGLYWTQFNALKVIDPGQNANTREANIRRHRFAMTTSLIIAFTIVLASGAGLGALGASLSAAIADIPVSALLADPANVVMVALMTLVGIVIPGLALAGTAYDPIREHLGPRILAVPRSLTPVVDGLRTRHLPADTTSEVHRLTWEAAQIDRARQEAHLLGTDHDLEDRVHAAFAALRDELTQIERALPGPAEPPADEDQPQERLRLVLDDVEARLASIAHPND